MAPNPSSTADKIIVDRTKANRNPDVARTIRRTRDKLSEQELDKRLDVLAMAKVKDGD